LHGKGRGVDGNQKNMPRLPNSFQLAGALKHVEDASQHSRIALHVDASQLRRRTDYCLGDRCRLVRFPIGWLFNYLDTWMVFLHAFVESSRAVTAVSCGLVAHHRQYGTFIPDCLGEPIGSVLTHAKVVGTHDHRRLTAPRADVDYNDGHVLARCEIDGGYNGIAVRRHQNNSLRALGDEVVDVGDLFSGVTVGIRDR
jgi:hypothetical protein